MDADISAQEMAASYRPAPHKPMAGCTEEEQESGEEHNLHQDSASHQKPNKSKLRAIFSENTGGGRGGGQRGGMGGSFSRGGRGGSFGRGGRGGSFRGKKGDSHRGRRGGKAGGFWEGERQAKGVDSSVKFERSREWEQAAKGEDFGGDRVKPQQRDGSRPWKRSHGGGHHQQQDRESLGHNQSCQYKKIKSDPN